MERNAFVELLNPLVLATRTEFDLPTWNAYFRALADVSEPLFAATVDGLLREPLAFFPKAGELRQACEKQRRVLLAAHRYDGCVECEDSIGWRPLLVDGVARVDRCPCKARYKARLAAMGLDVQVTPLVAPGGAGEVEAFPTLEQLPAPVRERLQLVAGQKAMR